MLQAAPIAGWLEFESWSPNGRFMAASEFTTPDQAVGSTCVLDVAGRRQLAADAPATVVNWHSARARVALRFDDPRRLRFFAAANGQARDLLTERPVTVTAWHNAGSGFAFITDYGRPWWLADALDTRETPVPLTGATLDSHSLKW